MVGRVGYVVIIFPILRDQKEEKLGMNVDMLIINPA